MTFKISHTTLKNFRWDFINVLYVLYDIKLFSKMIGILKSKLLHLNK